MKNSLLILTLLSCVSITAVSHADELDDLLGIDTKDKKTDNKKDDKKPIIKLDNKVKSQMTQADASKVFQVVVDDMKTVASKIGTEKDVSINTRRIQKGIVSKLDRLIYAMRPKKEKPDDKEKKKQESGSQGNKPGSKSGQKPGQKPSNTTSPFVSSSGSVNQHGEGGILQQKLGWGKLPARLREQLIEGKNEKTSPLYNRLAQQYLKAISQESSKNDKE